MLTKNISTNELSVQLGNPGFILLDIRPSAAYNGWKRKDEVRGGHIRGAVSFPLSWIKGLTSSELKSLLVSKGVTLKNTVVVYGYDPDDCSLMAKSLWDLGFKKVYIYEAGVQEWAADPGLPMEHLKNYEKLVHADWVAENCSDGKQRHKSEERTIFFEVSYDGLEDYKAGHIPGARYFDLASIECAPTWNVCSDDALLKTLLAQGITATSQVVLYGRNTMAATRVANVLMYAGVEDVRILDGGFDAWLRAGFRIETEVQQPIPARDFGQTIPGHPEYIFDLDKTKKLLGDNRAVLVCVRSWDEHVGKTSGYDYIQAKGRIAGSVWGHSGSDPHHMEDFRNPDGTMRSYHEIESNWQKAGITPDKKIAFYCGSGWRASETFFYAYLMGWQNITVYDGGWLEWSQDANNPIALGAP